MKKQIIGITGASGILGQFFVNKYKNYKFDIFTGDITNEKDVKNWIKKTKTRYILHLASKVSTKYVKKNYKNSLKVNYLGTKILVESIIDSKKKIWLFFSSSSHVYGNKNRKIKETDKRRPLTLYGKTKLYAEKYLLKISKKKVNICIGRIFSFTHKNQDLPYLIPTLLQKFNSNKKKILLENLNHDRDFCHLEDICKAINLLKKKSKTGVFNIGSGKSINLFTIANMINIDKKQIIYKKNIFKSSLIADISKIKKIGYKAKFGIRKILLDSYKK